MTDTLLATIVTAVGGIIVATIAGILSYRSARWNLRRDLEVELRRERLEAFKALWAMLEPLGQVGSPGPVAAPARLKGLSQELRHWYFTQGGMFLSDKSNEAYFNFLNAIQSAIDRTIDENQPLAADEFREITEAARMLRASLRDSFKGFPQM